MISLHGKHVLCMFDAVARDAQHDLFQLGFSHDDLHSRCNVCNAEAFGLSPEALGLSPLQPLSENDPCLERLLPRLQLVSVMSRTHKIFLS